MASEKLSFRDRIRDFFGIPPLAKDIPLSPDLVASIMRSSANYTPAVEAKFEEMVKSGWRKNELIFSCISKTAKTAAQVELKIYDKRTGDELPEHPLKKLLQKPNPEMTEYDFWSAVITFQKLAGIAYFEKERTNGNQVIRLWPLRPDWVKPKFSNAVEVNYYRYHPPGNADYADLDPADVLSFRVWDPMGLFSIWPPTAVAARVGDVDNDTTDLIKAFFQEGGAPLGLLSAAGKLRDEQVDELRARWRARYGGWKKWIDPAILDSGATFQRIGLTFKEMGFDALDARSEARICMVLDVPPILVGAKIGLDRATYSNYSEARRAWWEDSLIPMYADLLDVIINHLLPEFPDWENLDVRWDFNEVPALQEERNTRWTRATTAMTAGVLTINEFRAEVGLPNLGPAGDIYLRTAQQVEVPVNDTAAKALIIRSAYKTIQQTAQKSPMCRMEDETVDDCVARKIPEIMKDDPSMDQEQAIAMAFSMCRTSCEDMSKNTNHNGHQHDHNHGLIFDEKAASVGFDVRGRQKMERELAQIMTEYFKGQQKRLKEEING